MKFRALGFLAVLSLLVLAGPGQVRAVNAPPNTLCITDAPVVTVDPGRLLSDRILSEHYNGVTNDLWFARLNERPSRWEAIVGPAKPYAIHPKLVQSPSAISDQELVERLAQAGLRPANVRELIEVAASLRFDCCTEDAFSVADLRSSLTHREDYPNGYATQLVFYTPAANLPLEPVDMRELGPWGHSAATVSLLYSDLAQYYDDHVVSRGGSGSYRLEFENIPTAHQQPAKYDRGVYVVAVPI